MIRGVFFCAKVKCLFRPGQLEVLNHEIRNFHAFSLLSKPVFFGGPIRS